MADTHPNSKAKHLLIAKLLGDVTLTDADRAELANCSTKTVQRVRKATLSSAEAAGIDDAALRLFQTHIHEQIPFGELVEVLVDVLKQKDHRPSQLGAAKRLLELLGVVTRKEQKKQEEEGEHRPMMEFPPGCNPIINVNLKPGEPVKLGSHRPDQKSSASEPIKVDAVRISEGEE